MTFDEYKKLVDEYDETDSVSRREEIEDEIDGEATRLLHVLTVLYRKYGKDYVDDSDYQEGKGWISLREFDSYRVSLLYSDRWAYGGRCDIGIGVPMKYLDDESLKKLEDELVEERVKVLKVEIQRANKEINGWKNRIAEHEKELERLEGVRQ